MTPSKVQYAKSGKVNIAFRTAGEGKLDLLFVPGWVSNVGLLWEDPLSARFFDRLAAFSRLIVFDKRGTGLSDRDIGLPSLETRMDDCRAVLEAVGSQTSAVFGVSEGGPMSILFAATYPQHTTALITFGAYAKRVWSPDYPWAPTREQRQKFYEVIEDAWGGEMDMSSVAPSVEPGSPSFERLVHFFRMSASPASALALAKMNTDVDVTNLLSSIHVPALIMNARDDGDVSPEEAKFIAGRIPGAKLKIFPGVDHIVFLGDVDGITDEIEQFLTGKKQAREYDRVLATILFTDIVDSTHTASRLGDKNWAELLEKHNAMIATVVKTYRGHLVKSTGDGALARFDGPARAVRCAIEIERNVEQLGIKVRAGLHTGEIELMGSDIGGIAVHLASRVASEAAPGEVLASRTVKDICAGSGLEFISKGEHALKGFAEKWDLFSISLGPSGKLHQ